ncbi:MAG: hypothetical protein KA157_13645 [Aliarcobacter sp.]|nr:hypothetical protein [Aliarcobacter sp.]
MKERSDLKSRFIELLKKLNNGEQISFEDVEQNYLDIKEYLEKLDYIDEFPFDRDYSDCIYCFKKLNTDRRIFDKYHIEDIVKIITEFKENENYISDIQNIINESKLPRRDDEEYTIISSYEPYELTHCISYEMAIRNKDVIILLNSIRHLTTLSKKFFEYYMCYGNIIIKEDDYLDFEEIVTEALELLNHYEIAQKFDIKFKNYLILDIYSSIMQIITLLNMILEEDYYLIYDRKEIVPEGMEDILKEPNHHETDIELNQYMDKAIKESIRHAYDTSPRYKDNFTFKDGYSIYQASYEDSNEYDINKIFPNFKRPMKQFNQTQVAFNMSLPKDEIISYISKIKDDYDNKETSYKTLNQLLYEEDTRTEEKLEHNQQNRYADDFFIYDYYTQCGENHENKLEIIQKKLSQYHGMKIENGRNNYTLIDYDEAITKMQSKSTTNNSNSLDDLVARFQENEHIIHYIETIKIIENRYESLKNAIDNKRYKKLIHHE